MSKGPWKKKKRASSLSKKIQGSSVSTAELIDLVLSTDDWDLGALELKAHDLDKAPNSIAWMTEPKFAAFEPFPRQIEFATNLFEDYCPDCSTMSVVKDMWGLSFDDIKRSVTFLQNGVCPECGRNRNHFREEQKHNGVYELIGIAGQRCLDPETPVLMASNGVLPLRRLQVGDFLMDVNFGVTRVKKIWGTDQPGVFHIYIHVPTPGYHFQTVKITCGHEHQWVTDKGVVPSTSLDLASNISFLGQWASVVGIEKDKTPRKMIDIETESGTFLHPSGLTLHNSGKTFLTAVFGNYLLHRYLCLEGQAGDHYGLRNQLLMATFVASDKSQVSETTWGNFSAELRASQWFKQYFDYLDREGERTGTTLYEFKPEAFLSFYNKRILCSFAASNMVGLRGRTRFMGSIDELGWFETNTTAKKLNGREVYAALNNSLQTLRSTSETKWKAGKFDLPTAYMFNVSSPSAEDDPIMSLAAESRYNKRSYMFHYATWEINPTITQESLRPLMEKDPIKIMRDFGAEPGTGKNIFLPSGEILNANIEDTRFNAIKYGVQDMQQNIKGSVFNYVKVILSSVDVPRTVPHILACDMGESGNGFGMALCCREGAKMIISGAVLIQPRVMTDGTIATVHFPSAIELIKEIRKYVSLEMVVFDRWQSTTAIQELRDSKIFADRYSLKYKDFLDFKGRYLENNVKFPAPEIPYSSLMLQNIEDNMPIARLLKQIRTVRDNGKTIMKPQNADDDLFRCVVLADYFMNIHQVKFNTRLGINTIGSSVYGKSFYQSVKTAGVGYSGATTQNGVVFVKKRNTDKS